MKSRLLNALALALALSACAGAFPGNPQGYAGINKATITLDDEGRPSIEIIGGKEQEQMLIEFRRMGPEGAVEGRYIVSGARAFDGQKFRGEVETIVAEEVGAAAPAIVERIVEAACTAVGVRC